MFAARRIAQLGKIIFKFVFILSDRSFGQDGVVSVRERWFGESLFGARQKINNVITADFCGEWKEGGVE